MGWLGLERESFCLGGGGGFGACSFGGFGRGLGLGAGERGLSSSWALGSLWVA